MVGVQPFNIHSKVATPCHHGLQVAPVCALDTEKASEVDEGRLLLLPLALPLPLQTLLAALFPLSRDGRGKLWGDASHTHALPW